MAQCKKHGHYACPHCIEKERDNEPSGNPHLLGFEAHQKSYREQQKIYFRQVNIKLC